MQSLPNYRLDRWSPEFTSITETLAYVGHLDEAGTIFMMYKRRYPDAWLTMRMGARVIWEHIP